MIQVSPRTKQIFAYPHLEELIEKMQTIMRTIVDTVPFDGPNHQYLDELQPRDDESGDVDGDADDNDKVEDAGEQSLRLQLDDSDMEFEDVLEGNDGTSIYIDVHARQELMDDENIL